MPKKRELRDELAEKYHWDGYTATFHAVRIEICNKTGFSKVLDKVYEHYAKPIIKETNIEKLNKIKTKGNIMLRLSYPIALCSLVGVLLVSPVFSLGMIPGIYLNWRGEVEYFTSKDRIYNIRKTINLYIN